MNVVGESLGAWQTLPVNGMADIDISGVPQGVYLLKVSSGKDLVTRKISIIHP
jgi:hypothetical protein